MVDFVTTTLTLGVEVRRGEWSALSLFAAICAFRGERRAQKNGASNWRSEYAAKTDEDCLPVSCFVLGII